MIDTTLGIIIAVCTIACVGTVFYIIKVFSDDSKQGRGEALGDMTSYIPDDGTGKNSPAAKQEEDIDPVEAAIRAAELKTESNVYTQEGTKKYVADRAEPSK